MEEAGERQRVSGGLEISRCMYRVVGANYKRVSFRAIDKKKSSDVPSARGSRGKSSTFSHVVKLSEESNINSAADRLQGSIRKAFHRPKKGFPAIDFRETRFSTSAYSLKILAVVATYSSRPGT